MGFILRTLACATETKIMRYLTLSRFRNIDEVKRMPRIKVCESHNEIDSPEPDSRDNEIPLPKKKDYKIPTFICNSVQSTSKPSIAITSTVSSHLYTLYDLFFHVHRLTDSTWV